MAYEYINTVKSMLGITGTFHDETITAYIDEVRSYMINAGVEAETVDSAQAVGVIARGVSDLWDLGSGSAALSPYFKERVIQLAYKNKAGGGNV